MAWASRKAGGSSRVRRITYATMTTMAESQNGTRQPQLNNCSCGMATNGMKTMVESRPPAAEPLVTKLVVKPRRCSGECSSVMVIAAACSPDSDSPWIIRISTSRIGARAPMVA